MLDIYKPEMFPSFADWLSQFCDQRGMQRRVATACNVTPQAVTKWLKRGNIDPDQLKLLAAFANVDYSKLRLLADDMPSAEDKPSAKRLTRSEMGAIVGRKWEELDDPAQGQILNLIETLLNLQRSSYREYSEKQAELVKSRPKSKHPTT